MLEDIIEAPGRQMRPSKIVIILRGPPGCGKSFLAKNIKDTETLYGSSALRILALDDYFDLDRDLNMRDQTMVRQFEGSLLRSFQKTIREGFFPFIIVDCIHERVEKFAEMADFARNNGFQVCTSIFPIFTWKKFGGFLEEMVKDVIFNHLGIHLWATIRRRFMRIT